MKLLVLTFCVFWAFASFSQAKGELISYSFDSERLEVVLDNVSKQSGYQFSYNPEVLPDGSLFSMDAVELPIDRFLSRLLTGTGIKYAFYKDQIILTFQEPDLAVTKRDFFEISGTVIDETGVALPNVNIFLDGTTIGVYSDLDGNFRLERIPPGRYVLVFSYIGYSTGVYQIDERNGGARIQNHLMEVDMEQLQEVEVVSKRQPSRDGTWASSYEIFKNELLGPTNNAAECTIENPEVLSFKNDVDKNEIVAFASEPLEIRNDALGYQITYFLESFRKSPEDLRYRAKLRFRNLNPASRSEKRQWKRNRKESYYGSFNHFKQALLQDNIRKEGFRIYQLKKLKDYAKRKYQEVQVQDILVFKGDHFELDFKDYLLVEFQKEKESERFLSESQFAQIIYEDFIDMGQLNRSPDDQLSALQLLNGAVRLDLTGESLDRFGITTYGYWSWERIGDLVPINYNPKFDEF